MYEFKLPDLGEGIHEGEILKWHVKPGDVIKENDPLVDVETDKAAVTIPSPRGGTVTSVSGEVGKTVKVGNVITVIDDGQEAAPAKPAEAKPEKKTPERKKEAPEKKAPEAKAPEPKAPEKQASEKQAPEKKAPEGEEETGADEETVEAKKEPAEVKGKAPPSSDKAPTEKERAAGDGGRAAASRTASGGVLTADRPIVAAPATRRLARELGVDIRLVPPSGPGGRVTPEDVETFAKFGGADGARDTEAEAPRTAGAAAAGAPTGIPFLEIEPLPNFEQWGPVEKVPVRSIRRKVARKMTTSMILVPHVAHMDEADVTGLETFRKRERDKRKDQPGGKLTLLPFVMKAVAVALKESPQFNASLDPFSEEIIYKKYYNIGFAADTSKGLVVPVVRDVDKKSVLQISADIIALAGKAREEKLEVNDLRAGTFTITNVGAIGGFGSMPTINYPEVAILAMGRVTEKPVVRDGQIVIRTILPITLTYDHRVIDGADSARFTTKLVERLSDPNLLLLEM